MSTDPLILFALYAVAWTLLALLGLLLHATIEDWKEKQRHEDDPPEEWV